MILVKDLLNFIMYIDLANGVILVKNLLISNSKKEDLDITISKCP